MLILKKANVFITADSPCDLPKDITEKREITIVPLSVLLGEVSYRDGIDIKPQAIYDYVSKTKVLPKTSAVPIGQYYDLFKKLTEDGSEVVHISLSSGISSSYQNAVNAASEFSGVHIVDSRSLCHGFGLLVLKAADLRDKGLDAKKIADKVRKLVPKTSATFVINSLDYLHKGGRCSGVTKLGANLLGIKPEIAVNAETGTLDVSKKYRGKIDAVYKNYAKDILKNSDKMDKSRIFISNSGDVSKETIMFVKGLFEGAGKFEEIIIADAGCVISSHCGPKTFAIFYIKK
ncbi:MAG: DegV family protein [Escherichia coli]|nr:MAG: DegV family protein [Escherichia coli]